MSVQVLAVLEFIRNETLRIVRETCIQLPQIWGNQHILRHDKPFVVIETKHYISNSCHETQRNSKRPGFESHYAMDLLS